MTDLTNRQDPIDREKDEGRRALRIDAILNASPRQIDNYIDSNVTDLASAKEVLKLIAKIAILKP